MLVIRFRKFCVGVAISFFVLSMRFASGRRTLSGIRAISVKVQWSPPMLVLLPKVLAAARNCLGSEVVS